MITRTGRLDGRLHRRPQALVQVAELALEGGERLAERETDQLTLGA